MTISFVCGVGINWSRRGKNCSHANGFFNEKWPIKK